MTTHPRLKPHCRVLRRGPSAVQLGLDAGRGVVLEGLLPAELAFLEALDGTRSERELVAAAHLGGVPLERIRSLMASLRERGLVIDAPADRWDFARLAEDTRRRLAADADALTVCDPAQGNGYAVLGLRAHRTGVVNGEGDLPAALATLLRDAGVGSVVMGGYAGAAQAQELTGCESRAAGRHPSQSTSGDRLAGDGLAGDRTPDLVVLCSASPLTPDTGTPWQARRIPHMPVVLSGTTALIGPVVRPGRSACLRCMDLSRTELDAAWPVLLAQTAPIEVSPPPQVSGETSLVTVVAGLSAMVSLAVLDGRRHPVGRSLEVAFPWPDVVQRHWAPHPGCDCGAAAPQALDPPPLPLVSQPDPRQVRMAG